VRSVQGQINALANQVNYATINLKLWPSRWIAATSPIWDDLQEWLAGADERAYDAASGWVGGCTYPSMSTLSETVCLDKSMS
jgi:hypothetical protein